MSRIVRWATWWASTSVRLRRRESPLGCTSEISTDRITAATTAPFGWWRTRFCGITPRRSGSTGPAGNGVSLDALYSMIKSYDPGTLVVLNGIPTMSNGDWDVINLEAWGAWGDDLWGRWPFHLAWPKAHAVESWRLVADPAFEYSEGVQPDWQAYLRLQIALIGEGFIANIDHSPTIVSGVGEDGKLTSLDDSIVIARPPEDGGLD